MQLGMVECWFRLLGCKGRRAASSRMHHSGQCLPLSFAFFLEGEQPNWQE